MARKKVVSKNKCEDCGNCDCDSDKVGRSPVLTDDEKLRCEKLYSDMHTLVNNFRNESGNVDVYMATIPMAALLASMFSTLAVENGMDITNIEHMIVAFAQLTKEHCAINLETHRKHGGLPEGGIGHA